MNVCLSLFSARYILSLSLSFSLSLSPSLSLFLFLSLTLSPTSASFFFLSNLFRGFPTRMLYLKHVI